MSSTRAIALIIVFASTGLAIDGLRHRGLHRGLAERLRRHRGGS
jgi:hypothetical protein